MYKHIMARIIEFNKTVSRTITDFTYDGLPREKLIELYRDGRISSHFEEHTIARDYILTHVGGCLDHDLVDPSDSVVKYDEKTFTKRGCDFVPSCMKGTGRKFHKETFDEKSKNLIYIIVSVVKFPEIHTRFVKGSELAGLYPNGKIPLGDHDKFFELTRQ
jgi:hypothetical protein